MLLPNRSFVNESSRCGLTARAKGHVSGEVGLKEMRLGVEVHIISDMLVVLSIRRRVSPAVWLQKGVRLMHLCVGFLHHASLKGSEICSC